MFHLIIYVTSGSRSSLIVLQQGQQYDTDINLNHVDSYYHDYHCCFWDGGEVGGGVLLPLAKGHLSNVATMSGQTGWSYYRGIIVLPKIANSQFVFPVCQILNAAYQVEITVRAGSSIVKVLLEKMRQVL